MPGTEKNFKGKTSMNVIVERMELLYENIYNLLEAFRVASNSNTLQDVDVTLRNEDGTTRTVKVNSFHQLQQEVNILNNNFRALTNENNITYILNGDGQISQYTRTSFANSPYIDIEKITIPKTATTDFRDLISEMIYPSVRLPITINSEYYQYDCLARIFNITSGWDSIPDNPTILQLQQLINNGTVVSDPEEQHVLTPSKKQVTLFGAFNIENIQSTLYTLDTLYYTAINMNGNGHLLKVGDILVSDTGASKYRVLSVNQQDNIVELSRVSGVETLTVGIKKLYYNQTIDNSELVVGLPIKPRQQFVVFFSSESKVATSYPSLGVKIDTSNFNVTYNDTIYSIDEFYTDFVTNLADYLKAVCEESTIPYSQGIEPSAPELLTSNFQVVQINGHITNSSEIAEINKINTQKQSLLNEVDNYQRNINNLKAEISSNKYSSDKERSEKQNEIAQLESKIETLNASILSLSRNINEISLNNALEDSKAKYKVVGFWHIQDDLYSPATGIQKIVGYEVQYRYLSSSTDEIKNTTLKMVDNGSEVSVVFSAWNNCETPRLTKRKNIDGSVEWEEESITSVDEININQCMITIKENEAVEVRVRAISEAGYPTSPMKSAWSNIVRINFPSELKQTSLDGVLQQNEADIRNAEFRQILRNYGLLSHISSQLVDNGRTYAHEANMITSGLFTSEMKNIPLDEAMKSFERRIVELENKFSLNDIELYLVDFDGKEIPISNNSEIDIYAGRVSDQYDISEPKLYGNILRKKAYIKIKNPNSVSVEMKSLQPHGMETIDALYKVPIQTNSSFGFLQETGQIIYFRNLDLSLSQNFPIYQDWFQEDLKEYPKSQTDRVSTNCLFLNAQGEKEFGFADETVASFAGLSMDTPKIYQDIKILNKIALFNRVVKSSKQLLLENLTFSEEMKYAIGRYTTGAFFYPILQPLTSLQVKGQQSSSTLVLGAGQEILVPIIFEYRMFDALGRLDGEPKQEFKELKYEKTLGVSLNITNKPFTFDIKATVSL